jgi:hypothetical protein
VSSVVSMMSSGVPFAARAFSPICDEYFMPLR